MHAREVLTDFVKDGVADDLDFAWLAQLRYYFEEDKLNVKMVSAVLKYGNEYLGNQGRLVITPLTDRCYRTLMGALQVIINNMLL